MNGLRELVILADILLDKRTARDLVPPRDLVLPVQGKYVHIIRRIAPYAAGFEFVAVQIGKEKTGGPGAESLQEDPKRILYDGVEIQIGAQDSKRFYEKFFSVQDFLAAHAET